MTANISIRIVSSLTESQLLELRSLYLTAGWLEDTADIAFLPVAVRNSALFAGAFTGDGHLLGAARVLSDKVSDAYIQDVVVNPVYRRQGIGGDLVNLLVTELKKRGVDWIGIVGVPGTEKFYHGLGFEVLRDYVPMRYQCSQDEAGQSKNEEKM